MKIFLLFILVFLCFSVEAQDDVLDFAPDRKINVSPSGGNHPEQPPPNPRDSCRVFFFGKNSYHLKLWAVQSHYNPIEEAVEITWGRRTFQDMLTTEVDTAISLGTINPFHGKRMWFIWDTPANYSWRPFDARIPKIMKGYHRVFKRVSLTTTTYTCRSCPDKTSQTEITWLTDEDILWMDSLVTQKVKYEERAGMYIVSRIGRKNVYDPKFSPRDSLSDAEKNRILRIKEKWYTPLMKKGPAIQEILNNQKAFIFLRDIEAFTLYMSYEIDGMTMFVRTDNEDSENDRTDQLLRIFRTFEVLCLAAGSPIGPSRKE